MKKMSLSAAVVAVLWVIGSAFESPKVVPTYGRTGFDGNGDPVLIPLDPTNYNCVGTTNTCLYDENMKPISGELGTYTHL